jgi:membrane protein
MKKFSISKIWTFLTEDIWDIEPNSQPSLRRIGLKIARIVHMILRGFKEDECPLHASSLTFSTLMAIVPILALSLAIARGFGDTEIARLKAKEVVSEFTERMRQSDLQGTNLTQGVEILFGASETNGTDEAMTGSQLAEEIERLVDKGFDSAENISFKAIGGLGLIILMLMVIDVLSRVEASFNKVWGVTSGRPVLRKFTDYLAAVFILPFLVLMISSFPVMDLVSKFLPADAANQLRAAMGSPFLKNVTSMILTSLAFTFLLMFMPNTKVRLKAGLVGGLTAGILFVIWLWICAALQVGAVRSGKIYGSFAIVPILLAWVFVSWEIILLGAESAFAVQNFTTYRKEQRSRRASFKSRLILALCVTAEAAKRMISGEGSLDVSDYAVRNGLPVRFINDVVDELVRQGYVAELAGKRGCFALLRSPSEIKVQEVADAFVTYGEDAAKLGIPASNDMFKTFHELADKAVERSVGDMALSDVAGKITDAPPDES